MMKRNEKKKMIFQFHFLYPIALERTNCLICLMKSACEQIMKIKSASQILEPENDTFVRLFPTLNSINVAREDSVRFYLRHTRNLHFVTVTVTVTITVTICFPSFLVMLKVNFLLINFNCGTIELIIYC